MRGCCFSLKNRPSIKYYRFSHRMTIHLYLLIVFGLLIFAIGPGIFTQLYNVREPSVVISGVFASLSGYIALMVLLVIIGLGVHFKPFEAMIGLDHMWKVHKILAIIFLGLILIHIILKYVEYCYDNGENGEPSDYCDTKGYFEFMFSFEKYPGTYTIAVGCGRAMMYFWIIQVILSIFAKRPGKKRYIPHVVWYTYHIFSYLANIVIIIHCVYNKFNYVSPQSIITFIITGIFTLSIIGLTFYRLFSLFKTTIVGYYEILSTRMINETLMVMNIIPINQKSSIFRNPLQQAQPGQFLQLYGPNGTIHPLSFALINRGVKKARSIELIIRASGKYTTALRNYKPHDRLCASGPYGFFIPPFQSQSKCILMIASGSGISPCIGSMVTYGYRRSSSCHVIILWYIHNENDFATITNRLELINYKFINFKLVLISSKGQDYYYTTFPDSKHIPIDFLINTTITPEIIDRYVQELFDIAINNIGAKDHELTEQSDSKFDIDQSLSLYPNDGPQYMRHKLSTSLKHNKINKANESSDSSYIEFDDQSEGKQLLRDDSSSYSNSSTGIGLKISKLDKKSPIFDDMVIAYICGKKKYAKAWEKQLKAMKIQVFKENFSMI